jgi:sugar/nucleoside kinase (ribokinase family)
VKVNANGEDVAMPYEGEQIRLGDKRYAAADLRALLAVPGVRFEIGGGLLHSVKHLAWLQMHHNVPIEPAALDTTESSAAVQLKCKEFGIRYETLGLNPASLDLVVVSAHDPPDRVILKSPLPCRAFSNSSAEALRRVIDQCDVLLVNSAKNEAAVRAIVDEAKKSRVSLYGLLTPALSVRNNADLLLSNCQACVVTLSEFEPVARSLGVPCPADEMSANLIEVAIAMTEVCRLTQAGHMFVTLGPRGCIAADVDTGLVCHVGLKPTLRLIVKEKLLANPERITGAGDRFAAAVVIALEFLFKKGTLSSRAMKAALQASADVVKTFSRFLAPDKSWFEVSCLLLGTYGR